MANHMVMPIGVIGVVDKRRSGTNPNGSIAIPTASLATPANYASITAIRTRLNVVDAVAYSAANLDKMTLNDMIYALRKSDDNAGV